jgi:hypothetical protein
MDRPSNSASYRLHVPMVAAEAINTESHCTLLHAGDSAFVKFATALLGAIPNGDRAGAV